MGTLHCPHCFTDTPSTPCTNCGWQPGQDNPPPALTLGRVLDGRYRIGRVLGHGGFGITYLAWDENLQLRLAIKEYLPRDCASRAPDGVSLVVYSGQAGEQFIYGLDRFLDEARALAHFDQHPGIVTVKNFFRAHGTGYCVMDYVDGITLRAYLEQQPEGRISFDAALKLLMPVVDALRAVHKDGLLHRDIAPDNIYLTLDGRIKLMDFGAARFAAGEHSKSLSIILKPGFSPEEQYRTKGHQGPWTDVYGLAATCYRAITGKNPPESLDRLDNDELIPPSLLGIAITPNQEATLLKALAVKARERFQSMAELQQAWRTAAMPLSDPPTEAGMTESVTASVTPARRVSVKGKSPFVIAIAGVVTLLVMAGAVLWLGKAERTPPRTAAAPTVPAAPSAQAAPDSATSPVMAEQATASAVGAPPPTTAIPATTTAPAVAVGMGEPVIPQTLANPGLISPIYFAAELPPTANIPPEAPLCYKYLVAGPEEQLRKLKAKYPGLYDENILTNSDGSKTLHAKRKDEAGRETAYFYSTSPSVCNDYQKSRLDSESSEANVGGLGAADVESVIDFAGLPTPISIETKDAMRCESYATCLEVIESRQLSKARGWVNRKNKKICFRLILGGESCVANKTARDEYDTQGVEYYYLGTLTNPKYHVLQNLYWEGSEVLLVNAENGSRHVIDDMPIPSPDGTFVAVSSADLEAGFNANRFSIWKVNKAALVKVWSVEPDKWGPGAARWIDNTSIELKRFRFGQNLKGEWVDIELDPVRIKLKDNKWRLSN